MTRHRGFRKAWELGVVDGAYIGERRGSRGEARAKYDGHLGAGDAQVLTNRIRSHQHAVTKAGRKFHGAAESTSRGAWKRQSLTASPADSRSALRYAQGVEPENYLRYVFPSQGLLLLSMCKHQPRG